MAKPRFDNPYVASIIERCDNHILIARLSTTDDDAPLWCFPRGRATSEETPEDAMRRVTRDDLGIEVEIVVGQPPLAQDIDGAQAEVRYFFCGVITSDEKSGPYAELRWIPKHHLREYEFDDLSKPVAAWIVEA